MEEREWLRQCALHWVCILYALLGAPWIALKFPMMFLLVLGVTPTGYALLTRPPYPPSFGPDALTSTATAPATLHVRTRETRYNRAGETVAKLSGSARLRLRKTRQASAAAKVAPAPASS